MFGTTVICDLLASRSGETLAVRTSTELAIAIDRIKQAGLKSDHAGYLISRMVAASCWFLLTRAIPDKGLLITVRKSNSYPRLLN